MNNITNNESTINSNIISPQVEKLDIKNFEYLLEYNTYSVNREKNNETNNIKSTNVITSLRNKKKTDDSTIFKGKNKNYKIKDITDKINSEIKTTKNFNDLNKDFININYNTNIENNNKNISISDYHTESLYKLDKLKEKLEKLNITKTRENKIEDEYKTNPSRAMQKLFNTNYNKIEDELIIDSDSEEKEEENKELDIKFSIDYNNYNCNINNNIINIEEDV